MIPFGAWLPDQPDYRDEPSLIEALNVLPRPDGSYGPLGSLSSVGGALPARALGLASARALAGDRFTFAGTASHLYRLQVEGEWLQVSRSGGYSLEVGAFERPAFAQYGEYLIAAMGVGNALQSFNIDSGSQFADITGPRARHVAVVRDHAMLANTWDASQGERPDQVWFSAIGNPLSYPAIGSDAAKSVQSDRQVLPDGGHLQGIVSGIGGRDAAILGEHRIWTTQYVGSPIIFRFDPIEGARGCWSAGSIVPVGPVVYYLATDGWYVCDGAQSEPIGRGQVDEWFLRDLDGAYRAYIYGAYDTQRGVILWIYPGSGHNGGVPNKLIAFEPRTGRWSRGVVGADCMAPIFSVGYTLESLDALGYTLDELPFSLDAPIWKGGSPFVGVIDSTAHVLTTFGRSPLQADLTTNEFSGPNASRIWIDALRMYSDAENVSGAISYRDRVAGPLTTTSYVVQDEDFIDHLVACRYGRAKFRTPAGEVWTKASGYDARMRQEGLR